MSWGSAALADVAEIERKSIQPADILSGTRYVGLEHIESGGHSISFSSVDHGDLSSSKFQFGAHHVLFGKLRPYLAKIACPDFDGICSTDILPVLPGPDLDQRYLAYFLRQQHIVDWASSRATGINLPRLSPNELATLEIPLPSLDEQRRIAAILNKADALRRKRKRALDLLDCLTQSIFLEMFGELHGPASAYDTRPFGTLVANQKIGLVRSSKQLSSKSSGIPYLRMDAIGLNGILKLDPCQYTSASEREHREYELQDGDLLFNTRNSRELVGKTAIFQGPKGFIYNNNILRVRFTKDVIPQYILGYLRTPLATKELENRKSGTTSVYAIYQKSLETIPVVLPSLDRQQAYAKRMIWVSTLRKKLSELAKHDATFFASLQARAFSGQL